MRELMDTAPEQVLSEMARRLSSQLESGGMLEIADHIMRLVERKDNGALGLGENVWTRITEDRRRDEREKDKADELGDYRQNFRQANQQLQAELEEHRRTQHTLGGVTMSGEEWNNLASSMQNDEKVRDAMMRYYLNKGYSQAQAQQKVQDDIDATVAMGKPQSQWTAADRGAYNKAQNNPDYAGSVGAAQNAMRMGDNLSNQKVQTAIVSESQAVSIDQRNDLLAGTALDMRLVQKANSDPNFAASLSAYNKQRSITNDDAMTYVSPHDPSGLEDRFRVEVQDDNSNRRQVDIGNGVTLSQLSNPDGGVKSEISLGAEFAKANVATAPLDNPTLTNGNTPRQMASIQATITVPENVL
jgi:hypothetical protein